MFPEQIGTKTVDADIGFANGKVLRRPRLLLDDCEDPPSRVANHTAVAGWVREFGGDKSGGSVGMGLMIDQRLENGRGNERAIAIVHNQQSSQLGQRLAPGYQRMPGAFLLGLPDETDAARGYRVAHLVRLMPDHDEH